ncbi:biotin-dependent carboxyltransferase family protein [Devosia sp. A16]|uniref:5-oxoprolinase subunit C family protein n=1 Tax=Devosia sp. A16 TaxID=1736675 RepID=UPI0006D814B4|nr:biotin-dependent carboxyltransferase family protein [Devosia sp. A16]
MTGIRITRAGPLVTLQDAGRPGLLRHGISASGPMDRTAFERAGGWLGAAGTTGIEFTTAGLGLVAEGSVAIALDGGAFELSIDGEAKPWPARALLQPGAVVEIRPGSAGNYGYLRFDREVDIAPVMGSRATSCIAGIGGFGGRALQVGDVVPLGATLPRGRGQHPTPAAERDGPIRVVWGIHADRFDDVIRQRFVTDGFVVSPQLDRMGVRLADPHRVFAAARILSLVSDAVVPGDIQILGDGTPIVLMRDHQPTGGYPRIATVVSVDLDRFAQLRPGAPVRFEPVTVAHAEGLKP